LSVAQIFIAVQLFIHTLCLFYNETGILSLSIKKLGVVTSREAHPRAKQRYAS